MTDQKTLKETPENPTEAELETSLEQAEFPAASRMSKLMFGEEPTSDETTDQPENERSA